LNRKVPFYYKIYVAHALTDKRFKYLEPVWEAVEKFNELRNRISHQVQYPGYDDKVNEIIEILKNGFPEAFEEMESYGVNNSLAMVISLMYSNIRHIWKMKRVIDPPHSLSELN